MTYSVYDQLAFLLPGGIVLAAVIVGGWGWPWGDPGAGGVAVLAAAAYLAGHVNVALARWLQPAYLGHRPGTTPPGTWGLFDSRALATDRAAVEQAFESLVPGASLQTQYGVAVAHLQHQGRDAPLRHLSAQIGFYRNTATAAIVAVGTVVVWNLTGRTHVPVLPWALVGAVACGTYLSGYRRFWRRYAQQVAKALMADSSVCHDAPTTSPRGTSTRAT